MEISHLRLTEDASYLLFDNPASLMVGSLLLAYGGARVGAVAFNELKNVVFSRVTQTVQRQMARRCFSHLLALDPAYHHQAQPGALSRSIDRGIRGINFLFTALVFNILPTCFEIGLVGSILVKLHLTFIDVAIWLALWGSGSGYHGGLHWFNL